MPHGSIDLVPIILIRLSRNKLKRDKAKLVEKQGRKATDLSRQPGCLYYGNPASCSKDTIKRMFLMPLIPPEDSRHGRWLLCKGILGSRSNLETFWWVHP